MTTEKQLEDLFAKLDTEKLLFDWAKDLYEQDLKYGGIFEEPLEPTCTAMVLWTPQ